MGNQWCLPLPTIGLCKDHSLLLYDSNIIKAVPTNHHMFTIHASIMNTVKVVWPNKINLEHILCLLLKSSKNYPTKIFNQKLPGNILLDKIPSKSSTQNRLVPFRKLPLAPGCWWPDGAHARRGRRSDWCCGGCRFVISEKKGHNNKWLDGVGGFPFSMGFWVPTGGVGDLPFFHGFLGSKGN